jgi:hypothetical protein
LIWPSSGTVNLDSRPYDHLNRYKRHHVIMRDADEAHASAAAHGHGSSKFTFRYEEGQDDLWNCLNSSYYEDDLHDAKRDMPARELRELLYNPTACHFEELCLELFFGPRNDRPMGLYNLSINSLSCGGSYAPLISEASEASEALPTRVRVGPPS